jgi:hypothetical protein
MAGTNHFEDADIEGGLILSGMKGMGYEGVCRINMAQDISCWLAVMNMVT